MQERRYYRAESVLKTDEATFVPSKEVVNVLKSSQLLPHQLALMIGCPLILLRNLCGTQGPVNGTRLIVRGLQSHVLDAAIVTGSHKGDRVFIPRIDTRPDTNTPFTLQHCQFLCVWPLP